MLAAATSVLGVVLTHSAKCLAYSAMLAARIGQILVNVRAVTSKDALLRLKHAPWYRPLLLMLLCLNLKKMCALCCTSASTHEVYHVYRQQLAPRLAQTQQSHACQIQHIMHPI